jgi:hypothetical protein
MKDSLFLFKRNVLGKMNTLETVRKMNESTVLKTNARYILIIRAILELKHILC